MAGRDSHRALKAMVKVTEVFEAIANRIVTMAEKVLERESAASAATFSFSQPATSPTTPTFGAPMSPRSFFTSPQKGRAIPTVESAPTTRNITPVTSFLSAKKVDPDGYPRLSRDVMRPKTLVEIVGMEGFFVELHAWFCTLLQSLIKEFGS